MTVYSNNKDFNKFIKNLIKNGEWSFHDNGNSKHPYLQYKSGCKMPVPRSPKGDAPALQNFKAAVRRIERDNAIQIFRQPGINSI